MSTEQVLVTGGSEGIGRGLAARFLARGARVLVSGRSAEKLAAAAAALPGLETVVSDIGDAGAREALAAHVRQVMPGLSVVVNNAGIQRRVPLALDEAPWAERQREIDVLLAGPAHLNHLLVPRLLERDASLLVNVTSGGAIVPQPFAPMYSACKAAVHAYTMTLRHALAGTSCRVVELIPPAVKTALTGDAAKAHGADLDAFCDEVFPQLLAAGATEVGYGPTRDAARAARDELAALFTASAGRFPVGTYAGGI